jgi:hypothetical protein
MAGNDPYGSPTSNAASAREAINLPAIAMIVMAGLGFLLSLPGLFGSGQSEALNSMINNGSMPREQAEALAKFAAVSGGVMGKLFTLFSMALNGFIVYAAVKIRNLQNHHLGVAASIGLMLPIAGCCCCLGLPLGLYTITILNRPDIRAEFK